MLRVSKPYLSVGSNANPILFPRDFTGVKTFLLGVSL